LWIAVIALIAAVPAASHLPLFVRPSGGGTPQPFRWDFTSFPVRWSLNPSVRSNISGERSVGQVIEAAFASWTNAPNAAVSVGRGSDSAKASRGFDGVNLICFVCGGDFDSNGTLAITVTTVSDRVGEDDGHGGRSRFVGQILDSDILFNPARDFSTGGGSAQDMQTVAVHEAGHFLGLDHSGIVRAVMFPFAPDLLRTLGYDDVAGLAALYPEASPAVSTGSLSGTVRLGGNAVFGAHVYADSISDRHAFGSSIRKTPIGAVTRPDGTYQITGLPPDTYIVIAEPLDEPVTNENIDSYATAFSRSSVQTGFTTRWH
jgi:hypothetical protein